MRDRFSSKVPNSLRVFIAGAVCILGLLTVDAAKAQMAQNAVEPTHSSHALLHRASFADALVSGKIDGMQLRHKAALQTFYQTRQNQSYWMSESAIYSRAERMYKAIDEAWTHGLNPHNYHYIEIYRLMGRAIICTVVPSWNCY